MIALDADKINVGAQRLENRAYGWEVADMNHNHAGKLWQEGKRKMCPSLSMTAEVPLEQESYNNRWKQPINGTADVLNRLSMTIEVKQ